MRLVRFDCGCIGTSPEDSGKHMTVRSCNRGNAVEGRKFYTPNMDGLDCWGQKAFVELSSDAADCELDNMFKLVADGYNFRKIKQIFKE